MRSLIVLSILLSATLSSAVAGNNPPKLGGWVPIKNLADLVVQEIASFTVAENNKMTNNILKLSRVVSGETQVVFGMKYRLIIEAVAGNEGGEGEKYEAIVYVKLGGKSRELISFKKVKSVGHSPLSVGGYHPIKNLSDPVVQDIASFAVDEYNKKTENTLKLKLSYVVKGETQVVEGTNYRLIIEAAYINGGSHAGKYEAIVYVKLDGKSRELISFKSVGHSPLPGGYHPIKNLSDPVVQDIASFAVDEYNKKPENALKLKLSNVVKGETQVVEGTNYRLIIEAAYINGGSDAGKYEAIVYVKLDGKSRELISFKKVKY